MLKGLGRIALTLFRSNLSSKGNYLLYFTLPFSAFPRRISKGFTKNNELKVKGKFQHIIPRNQQVSLKMNPLQNIYKVLAWTSHKHLLPSEQPIKCTLVSLLQRTQVNGYIYEKALFILSCFGLQPFHWLATSSTPLAYLWLSPSILYMRLQIFSPKDIKATIFQKELVDLNT